MIPYGKPITWGQVLHHTKAEIDAFGKKDDSDWVNEMIGSMELSLTDADVARFIPNEPLDTARRKIQHHIARWLREEGYATSISEL